MGESIIDSRETEVLCMIHGFWQNQNYTIRYQTDGKKMCVCVLSGQLGLGGWGLLERVLVQLLKNHPNTSWFTTNYKYDGVYAQLMKRQKAIQVTTTHSTALVCYENNN